MLTKDISVNPKRADAQAMSKTPRNTSVRTMSVAKTSKRAGFCQGGRRETFTNWKTVANLAQRWADGPSIWEMWVNNGPSVSDTWNSTPVWGFPYNATGLAPHPMASALVDGGLSGKVIGIGPYAMIDENWFLEADVYRGLSDHLGDIVGTHLTGQDRAADAAVYWRAAYAKEMGAHYFQIGTYGLSGSVFPGGDTSTGRADEFFDLALDANYQWTANPKNVASDVVSIHSTFIRERSRLRANALLNGTNDRNTLNTFRADMTYSFGATINPSVQYFRTWGTADANLYAGANGGIPNSSGWITEIAYVPWGKPGSWIGFANVKLALQYIAYTQFDGFKRGASDNNTLQGNIWLATHF